MPAKLLVGLIARRSLNQCQSICIHLENKQTHLTDVLVSVASSFIKTINLQIQTDIEYDLL